jgi:hypothetical protein
MSFFAFRFVSIEYALPAVFLLHLSGRAIDVPGDAIQRYEVKASANNDDN